MSDSLHEFRDLMDSLILSGRSSQEVARTLGIRSETVRKRRKMLRYAGLLPAKTIEANNARRKHDPH
jgi:biotin operon repressor